MYGLTVIKYQENTSIRYTYNLGHKIPFSNRVKCVTRTSDRKPAIGLKNHWNADKAVQKMVLNQK